MTWDPIQYSYCALIADGYAVIESEVIDSFADTRTSASRLADVAEPSGKRRRASEYRGGGRGDHAKPGEQVAAKVDRSNENGSWILGSVIDYDPHRDLYEVQDEDETSRIMTLSHHEVKRLDDGSAQYRKGDGVLCVFPDTTSFYRAVVARNPKPSPHGGISLELIVRFEDDEDDSGQAPPRRVPTRFVLRRSDVEEDDDE
jgi:SGF29 tudor-like domain